MRRKQLGKTLREIREGLGISMDQAAVALDCARTRVGHLETGRNAVSKPVLEALCRLYEVSPEVAEQLEDLRRESSKRGWWATYRLPPWLQAYIGMEVDATTLRNFTLELIPGLAQTEDYARRLHELHGNVPAEEIQRRVAARLERQRRLTAEHPMNFSAVISEGALRRLTAEDDSVAVDQLRHLEGLAQLPNVSLQVIPFAAGLHHSMNGSFTLLDFDTGVSMPVAYQEYAVGGHLVDDQDVVQQLSVVYDQLRDQALGPNESLIFISELTQQFEGKETPGG